MCKEFIAKYNFKSNEMCMIGDQIVTDIYGGNRFGTFNILVDFINTFEILFSYR